MVSHFLPQCPYLWNTDDYNRAHFLELLGPINGMIHTKRLDQCLAYTKLSINVSHFEGGEGV